MTRTGIFRLAICLGPLLVGCQLNASAPDRPVVTLSAPPPPIAGGTLLVTSDGRLAVVGDSDRDAIHVVDLERRVRTRRLAMPERSEPGRLVQSDDGRVYALLRSGGAIVSFDPRSDEDLELTPVCAAPRGLDVDAEARLFIVCASGELLLWERAAAPRRIGEVGPGARDIVVLGDRLLISHLRSAEISVLSTDGTWQATLRPPAWQSAEGSPLYTPNTALRLRRSGGGAVLLYQRSRLGPEPVPVGCPTSDRPLLGPCRTSGVHVAVSEVSPTGIGPGAILSRGTFVVDVDVRADGLLGLASPAEIGGLDRQRTRRVRRARPGGEACLEDVDGPRLDGQPTAVAWAPDGELVAFSREPAALWIGGDPVGLDEPSRRDTGHDLFHAARGSVSCASCHVEGGDDGHVWTLSGGEARRTRSLRGGISASAPFLADGSALSLQHEVMTPSPHGAEPGPEIYLDPARAEALAAWLDELRPPLGRAAAESVLASGAAVFEAQGCAACHAGALGTRAENVELGGHSRQVPTLVGLAERDPYLADGCARELAQVFEQSCGLGQEHTRVTALLGAAHSALEAYLLAR